MLVKTIVMPWDCQSETPGMRSLLGEFEEEHDREQGGKNQGKYPVQSPEIICVAHEVREKLLVPAR